MDLNEKIEQEIIYSMLKNKALAQEGTILGILLKDDKSLARDIPALRETIRERIATIIREIPEMNDATSSRSAQEPFSDVIISHLTDYAASRGVIYQEKPSERKDMVELEVKGDFVVRIPPEPSKHLHIGHALSFLINTTYAKRYASKGHTTRIVLRLEDTNPGLSTQEYVDSILDDITTYLEIVPDTISYSSDHMEVFYDAARTLLTNKDAYVCRCTPEDMANQRKDGIPCPHRDFSSIEAFESILAGKYLPGEACIRLRGDMESKNMVMRDPVILRISDVPHYRQGKKYRLWPLYDFENSIMDALEGITHVLRSNEFGTMRTELQQSIRARLGYAQPAIHQYGRFVIKDAETKGREIREKIAQGTYTGWDDVRLVTLKALKRRGIRAQALIEIAREVGLSPTPTTIDWKMLAKYNRRIIDETARRYSYLPAPLPIHITGMPHRTVTLPMHPKQDLGTRTFALTERVLIRSEDALPYFRLMDAGNIRHEGSSYTYESEDVDTFRSKGGSAIINWLADDPAQTTEASILLPDGRIENGIIEATILAASIGDIVQLERYGFARIESLKPVTLIYSHK